MTYYEILGVESSAAVEEIRTAYRKLAQENHPDKGGDAEKFTEIQKAYDVLSSSEKRAIYDKTGYFSEAGIDENLMILREIVGMVLAIINDNPAIDVSKVSLIDLTLSLINNKQSSLRGESGKLAERVRKYGQAIERFRTRDVSKPNLVGQMIAHEMKKLEAKIVEIEGVVETGNKMKECLNEYQYEFEQMMHSGLFLHLS